MILINLLEAIKKNQLNTFLTNNNIHIDVDFIDIYMKDKISKDSEIGLFNVEEIPNLLNIKIDNICYINLFPLSLLIELVTIDFKLINGAELNDKIISYRLNDA